MSEAKSQEEERYGSSPPSSLQGYESQNVDLQSCGLASPIFGPFQSSRNPSGDNMLPSSQGDRSSDLEEGNQAEKIASSGEERCQGQQQGEDQMSQMEVEGDANPGVQMAILTHKVEELLRIVRAQDKVIQGLKEELEDEKVRNSRSRENFGDRIFKIGRGLQEVRGFVNREFSTYYWRIPNVRKNMHRAKQDRAVIRCDDLFCIGRNGYQMRLLVYLDGFGQGEGTHLSVFWILEEGPNDCFLKWPFPYAIRFELLPALQKQQPAMFSTHIVSGHPAFQQPVRGAKPDKFGCELFITLKKLKDYFIHADDCIYLRVYAHLLS